MVKETSRGWKRSRARGFATQPKLNRVYPKPPSLVVLPVSSDPGPSYLSAQAHPWFDAYPKWPPAAMTSATDRGTGRIVVAGEGRRDKLLLALQKVLLVGGITLMGVFVGARLEGRFLSGMAVASFDAAQASRPRVQRAKAVDAKVDFTLWSETRIEAYKRSLAERWPRPLAVLRVPKIGLEAPVLEGTDDLTLNRGLGHVRNTARVGEVGNVGIAGHRDGFFRGLKDVGVGDRLELSLPDRTDTYVVESVEIVDPSDVRVLKPTTKASLTLITCYPFYFVGSAPQRYIVHASIVRSERLSRKASEQGGSR